MLSSLSSSSYEPPTSLAAVQQVWPLVQSLPELLHHAPTVVDMLLALLEDPVVVTQVRPKALAASALFAFSCIVISHNTSFPLGCACATIRRTTRRGCQKQMVRFRRALDDETVPTLPLSSPSSLLLQSNQGLKIGLGGWYLLLGYTLAGSTSDSPDRCTEHRTVPSRAVRCPISSTSCRLTPQS